MIETDQWRDALLEKTRMQPLRRIGDSPGLVIQQTVEIPCRLPSGSTEVQVIPAGAVLLPQVAVLGANDMGHQTHHLEHVDTMEELANLKTLHQSPIAMAARTWKSSRAQQARGWPF